MAQISESEYLICQGRDGLSQVCRLAVIAGSFKLPDYYASIITGITENETMMTIAEKVKTNRLRNAWSQEQLAEIASLSVRTVQRTEKGQKPSLETLSALASAFDINVSDLSDESYIASNVLDERISEAKIQVEQETQFYRILLTAVLVCAALIIINSLFTPESYWSVVVAVIWGGLVIFRGIRVFIMRGKITLWQQRRLQKILRSGNKSPDNKTTKR